MVPDLAPDFSWVDGMMLSISHSHEILSLAAAASYRELERPSLLLEHDLFRKLVSTHSASKT
jgi:hypothetical protein